MHVDRRHRRLAIIGMAVAALGAGALTIATANQASAEEGCEVDYDVVNDWGSGFQTNITITAGEPINGWTLTWDFPSGTSISSAWNVNWSQSGTTFTGSDVGWNGTIASGQSSQVFGFIGNGNPTTPGQFTINGDLCDGQIDNPTTDDEPTSDEPTTDSPTGPVSIMPLGDSITGSPGCWRGNLWDQLTRAGHDVDFVGTLSQACEPAGSDPDHEGHGGFQVTQSVANGDTRMWLETNTPDVLMMHFGTNDVWSAIPPDQVLDAFTSIVEDLRELNPDAIILVAQIIPLHPDESFGCADCPQRAIDLNAEIPGWAAGLTTEQSPIVVIDQHTGFDPATDTYDGVHPDADGNVKIAANWFDALDEILT